MKLFQKIREIKSKEGLLHFRRYAIIETKWFAIYIHRIYRDIKEPYLHDHPWNFLTVILWGGYYERIKKGCDTELIERKFGSVVFHKAEQPHNVSLRENCIKVHDLLDNVTEIFTWKQTSTSLVITGPRFREWGYHTPDGWKEGKVEYPEWKKKNV